MTQERVAERVGKERPTIANALRLLKLPDIALQALRDGDISAGHARALLPLANSGHMQRALIRIQDEQLSVRATERLVQRLVNGVEGGQQAERLRREKAMGPVNRRLTKALSAGVAVRPRKGGGGRIVIDFADSEDLDRLIELLERP